MLNSQRSFRHGAHRFVHAVMAISTLLTSAFWCIGAFAQSYPTRPIKLVVPFPAGGPADVLGRLITQKLSESFGSPVIVDNRSGANGIIGTDLVAKASPDGYMMLINTGSTTINAHVYSKLPYDLMRDLAPVTMVAAPSGLVLVSHPSLGVSSVKDLIALAKQKPGQISFSSSGNGSALQLAGELFSAIAGVKLVPVPYEAAGPAFNDFLSWQAQLMFPATVAVMSSVDFGRVAVVGPTVATRVPGRRN